MKNPNGFGCVYKAKDKRRRRPWIAKTPAYDVPGRIGKVRKIIGQYATRQEAMLALAQWHQQESPVPVEKENITLEQIYKEYTHTQRFVNLSKQTQNCYYAAFEYMSGIKNYKVRDLRTAHYQSAVDNAIKQGKSLSTLQKIRAFAGLLCDYAVQQDIVTKNYASFIVLPRSEQKEKTPFTDIQLNKLEQAAKDGFMYADLIVIMCYTGWRINEFLSLTPFSFNENDFTLTGGSKTAAGRNRTVPVSPKVLPYLKKWINKGGETIVCRESAGKLIKVTDKYFREKWYYPTLEALGLPKLTPHATRHTFASMLYRNGADKWDIQRLMGHASLDTTNKIYTHVDIEHLKNAVALL